MAALPSTMLYATLGRFFEEVKRRNDGLNEQMQAFAAIQLEIAELQRRAPHDTEARRRLDRFTIAMNGELGELNERLQQCTEQLQSHFTQLEATLLQPGAEPTEHRGTHHKSGSRLNRKFV